MSTPGVGVPGNGRIPGPPYTPYYNPSMNNARFNPTMAVIIIVLIGGCFVLGFMSVFIRKCMTDESATTTSSERSRNWSSKTRGLDKEAVDALPLVHITDLDEKEDLECPVCLTEFEPEDSLRLLPACKHVFHQECIDSWFDAHSTCPLCRASLTGKVEVVSNSSGEQGAPREQVETVAEVSENGDSDIELQPVNDAPREDSRTDTATPTPGATISREVERNSARGTLSRNSHSFKCAARGTTALEKAASLGAAGAQFNKPHTGANMRKPPLTPPTTTGIRRSSSLGTDLIALRNLLTGGDQNGVRDSNSSASYRLNATRSAVPKSDAPATSRFTRARSMDLGTRDRSLLSEHSRDNWSTIDLETGKPLAAGAITSKGESSKGPAMAGAAPERAWSDRWSLASLRGAMFPLSRSTSDVTSRVNSHSPV